MGDSAPRPSARRDGDVAANGTSDPSRRVDARGTWKPYMVAYEVIKAMRGVPSGSLIEVVTKDNAGILQDLQTWCEATGNELTASQPSGDGLVVSLVRKGAPQASGRTMTVIFSTAALEHVVFPFDKALAGAVLGMQVNAVFEGAGVRLLKRGYRPKLSGVIGRPFSPMVERVMRRQIGWPLPGPSVEALEDLGAQFYVCGPSMFGYGVREDELMVKRCTIGAVVTWADLLSRSDVQVFSKAQFEKP